MIYTYGDFEVDFNNYNRLLSSELQIGTPLIKSGVGFIERVPDNAIMLLDSIYFIYIGDQSLTGTYCRYQVVETSGNVLYTCAGSSDLQQTWPVLVSFLRDNCTIYTAANVMDNYLPNLIIKGGWIYELLIDNPGPADIIGELIITYRILRLDR
jgi:hypothetical protein